MVNIAGYELASASVDYVNPIPILVDERISCWEACARGDRILVVLLKKGPDHPIIWSHMETWRRIQKYTYLKPLLRWLNEYERPSDFMTAYANGEVPWAK